jgi:membrane protease YdiL (CAAX protease family)
LIVIGIALIWDGSYVRNLRLPLYDPAQIQDLALFFIGAIVVSFLSRYTYGTKQENIIFVIFFPIIEEILFRGINLMLLLRSSLLTEKTAIIINGLLFGIMHIQYFGLSMKMLGNIIIAAIGGYYFAMITVDTGSILPSILLHIVFNFSAIMYSKYKLRNSSL